MIIRKLAANEMDAHFKVSSISFVWPYTSINEEEEKNTVIGAFEDDNKTLMANVELFNQEASFNGNFIKSIGIGGVATFPQYRRKGAVRELFNELEKMSEKENWTFGILYPFRTEYYRQFGYEQSVKSFDITTDFSNLINVPRSSSGTLYEGENTEELLSVYNKFAEKYNFMIKRNDATYFPEKPYKECRYTYLWRDENDVAKAYATYRIGRDEDTIIIEELAYADKESLLGILGLLRSYDGNVKKVIFTGIPKDSPLFDIMPEHSKCKYEMKYRASIRIFNFEKMLKLLDYPVEHGKVVVKLNDSIEINNGTFEIEYQDGKVQINKVKDKEADISLTPCAASRLFLSGENFDREKLDYIKGVDISGDIDDLLRILPKNPTNIWDTF